MSLDWMVTRLAWIAVMTMLVVVLLKKINASGNAAEVITYHTSWCPQTERRGRPQRTPEEHRWRMTGSGGRT